MKNRKEGTIHSILGPESSFKGELKFNEGQTLIGGRFEGSIETKTTLIIGDTAQVKGTFHVGDIIIRGSLEGDVVATDSIVVEKPAKVTGTLQSKVLTIEPGVLFDGSCTMAAKTTKSEQAHQGKRNNKQNGNVATVN